MNNFTINASKNMAVAIAGKSTPRHTVTPLGLSRTLDGCDTVVLEHMFKMKLTAMIEHPLISTDCSLCKLWQTLDQDGDTYYIAACAEVSD